MPTTAEQHTDEPPSYQPQQPIPSPPYTQHSFASMPPPPPQTPTLKPSLGLPSRLLLSTLSIPLISLLFVAFRLLSSSRNASDSVASTKASLLSACHNAESVASLTASLPHFLATTANVHLSQSITSSVHGAARVFSLSLTAIEKVLTYIIDSYRSLFLCFMELLVRGSLAVLIEAVQLISQAITAAGQGIRAAIQESVSEANTLLSTAISGINDVVGVFGQRITPPNIPVPNLQALTNITLPHEIEDGLLKLNATLPTLDEVRQKMDAIIQGPFERMKLEVSHTLGGWTFNDSLLEPPRMENITFCDRVNMDPLDELGMQLERVAKWGLIFIALVAMLVVLVSVGWEWWRYRREVRAVERTKEVYLARYAGEKGKVLEKENLTQLLTISRHPLISSFAQTFCGRVGFRTARAQDRISWLVCFLTHPASLACLFTGLLGLLSVSLQSFLLHRMTANYASDIDTSLTHLSSDVISLVNSHTANASATFSRSTNAIISDIETELNTHVFAWVNTTTSTLNTTLNEFLDGITDALTTTFGGTPFNAPLQTFVQCILGQKVRGVEKAFTWIQENSHVEFDRVPEDVLMVGVERGQVLLRPVREALVGGADGEGKGVVGRAIEGYEERLRDERILFLVLVGIWLAILLVALLVVFYATLVDSRLEKEVKEGGEGMGGEEVEEKLRDDLTAAPGVQTWPNFSRFRKEKKEPVSTTPHQLRDLVLRPSSPTHSNRSNRTHVAKESISYPFQVHHSLKTSSQARQPTPLRTITTTPTAQPDRNATLSTSHPAQPVSEDRRSSRSSWLSFLATLATSDDAATEERRRAAAEDRFHRLFGCSPAASPTTSQFAHHMSTPVEVNRERRCRETLDLLPKGTNWMGGRSPLLHPSTRGDEGEADSSRSTEVHLTRSGPTGEENGTMARSESYSVADTTGATKVEQQQQQQQQQRIPSTHSIPFYAW
ncbi:related to PRM1-Pheromone-regulated multispanning membrane protein [Ustilago bromivora]|uniref:Plasma membrane fusion protein PRM1 n=1 Tax=Ustilago bromivora TaxID=307758 RepID=A0A1K0HE36_9BASI|nr:related to PRM1-Pheromone-regulated multispanning membrane protein [Ustilago bromivora]